MKEIIVKKDLVDAGFNIIAERYKLIAQYGNCGAQLLHKGRAVVYVEDNGHFKTEYLLDKKESEAALRAPDIFLDDMVLEWITNEDDAQLSYYQWFIEKIGTDFGENGPCRVMIVKCFCNCTPIEWVKNESGEDIVFDTPALAQDWITEHENDPYYLKHGEAGRPDYYIIAC